MNQLSLLPLSNGPSGPNTLGHRIYRSAELSHDGQYRWWLRRQWTGGNGEFACFIMLNPSTADASIDDPTIRRCMNFARTWGYSGLIVKNLFAYRSTNPHALFTATEPTGDPRNMQELCATLSAGPVVLAWGLAVPFGRDRLILERFAQCQSPPLYCLGLTKGGHPRHPLYVRGTTPFVAYAQLPTP